MEKELKVGALQMTAAMIISGTIGAFVLFSGQPVTTVVFFRCLIGAIALFLFGIGAGNGCSHLTPKVVLIAALGGVALVINWLLLFSAYSRISIGITTVVYNTQPLMLVLLSMLFLGEKVSRIKWLWLITAFIGMALVLLSSLSAETGSGWLVGIIMALGAAFFYALTALITRHLKGIPPQQIALVQVFVGVLMLLPVADFHLSASFGEWGAIITLGILHTGIMYQLLYGGIQKLPTPVAGSLSFIYPIVAVLIDKIMFGHSFTLLQLLGGALILLSAAGSNLGWGERSGERKRERGIESEGEKIAVLHHTANAGSSLKNCD